MVHTQSKCVWRSALMYESKVGILWEQPSFHLSSGEKILVFLRFKVFARVTAFLQHPRAFLSHSFK